ncbi:C-terminal processing peptidase-3. Serine peptidase. MEROPS family S41A [Spirosomataceae bacterium TFI 002]|nr:C-terminal processing peptidase-3. Serine peptidase. MEROPS family S41A [Spirosomataceae bacterium TFI 002]
MFLHKKMKKFRKYLLLALLPAVIGIFSFTVDDRYFEIAKNLDIFATMFKELNSLYVDEINPTKAMRVGIQAMLKELDPYTNFYPEDDIEDYRTLTTGKYNGIGATTAFDGKKHTIVMIYQYSPADKAGLKIGDELVSVDKVTLAGKDDDQLGRLLKGQRGTKVDLEVNRYGEKKPISLSIERDIVKTSDVPHYGMIDEKTGYIQLKDFSATAAKEIKAAFEEMKGQGMQSLVLDLRSNPGGLLNMAIDISNFFIPKGKLVVETKGKVGEWNKKYGTQNQPLDTEMPVVVLINGSSASASEIVSGTLQDYDRGVLIGQRSFGKGLVQTTRPLSYNTQLKVTTAKYYIPSGRCIQAIDYSHRNPDGSVGKLPDSLRSTFYTSNKRLVLDGGGVDPDIYVKPKELSDFTKQLVSSKLIFDYATKYYFEHIKDEPGNLFMPSEAILADFKTFIKNKNFEYESEVSKSLKTLETESKKDPLLNELQSSIAQLKAKVGTANEAKFEQYKMEIKEQLALEILSRYHYDKVMKFVSFERDPEVQKALELFKNPAEYKKILAGK